MGQSQDRKQQAFPLVKDHSGKGRDEFLQQGSQPQNARMLRVTTPDGVERLSAANISNTFLTHEHRRKSTCPPYHIVHCFIPFLMYSSAAFTFSISFRTENNTPTQIKMSSRHTIHIFICFLLFSSIVLFILYSFTVLPYSRQQFTQIFAQQNRKKIQASTVQCNHEDFSDHRQKILPLNWLSLHQSTIFDLHMRSAQLSSEASTKHWHSWLWCSWLWC